MKSVVVCLSGGVDSAVAAILLKAQGYDVVGLTFWFWSFPRAASARLTPRSSLDAAAQAAHEIGIPHETIDASDAFERLVLRDFVTRYRRGETPNPCGRCNRDLRFALALEYARQHGFDGVATGHHARVRRESDGRYGLYRGSDPAKDQTYFLYGLTQEQLSCLLFPVGELTKPAVFELARRKGLSAAHRRESQDVCFAVDGETAYLFDATDLASGPIVDETGRVLGTHKGLPRYTIGQRRGLGISAVHPLFVVAVDAQRNALVVGPDEALWRSTLEAIDVNYIADPPLEGARIDAKVRYRSRASAATFVAGPPNGFSLQFMTPQRAVTPGQLAVLYDGDRLLGGGTILPPRAADSPAPL